MSKEVLHIYTRVSTSQQADEGTSLDSQKAFGIKRAEELGMDYEIHDETSASSSKEDFTNRPVLMSILRGIEDGRIKNLYVYKTDRLSRNNTTWAIIRTKLKDANCILYTSDGKTDLTSHLDNLIFGILSEIAQYDNELRTERLREGKRQKAIKGYWFGGPAPFGYKVSAQKKLVVDKSQSMWVEKIFKWYSDGKSPKWIKSRLDGKVNTNRGKAIWSIGSVESILRNTHPGGHYFYLNQKIDCPRIVDDESWQGVQKRLQDQKNRERGNNQTVHEYPLKKVMFCGHCGSRMGGRSQKTKNGYRLSYACTSRHETWRTQSAKGDWDRSKSCINNVSMKAEITEQTVWDTVLLVLKESKLRREDFKKKTFATLEDASLTTEESIVSMKRKIDRQKDLISSLEEAIAEQEVRKIIEKPQVSQIDKILTALHDEKDNLLSKLVTFENDLRLLEDSSNWVDWYNDYQNDLRELSRIQEDKRIDVISRYVERIDVFYDPDAKRHKLSIHFKLPIVGDRLKWRDPKKKSLGYDLTEGDRVMGIELDRE
jgi:DNA invertase Pin-like site-specific DNA recombinase